MPLAMRARRLWPDRNPLRRAADRAEFAIAALLLVALLAGVPLTALTVARWAAASGLRAERGPGRVAPGAGGPAARRAHAARRPVLPGAVAAGAGPVGQPGRAAHREDRRPPGAKAGSTVMVWIDRPGRLTGAPVAAAGLAGRVLLAAMAAPVALSVMLLVLWAYAGIFLDWRRMAAWDADWAVTEPQWTGRH